MSESKPFDWKFTMTAIPPRQPRSTLTPERAEILALRTGLRKAFASEAAVLKSRYVMLSKLRSARVQIAKLEAEVEHEKHAQDGLKEDVERARAERAAEIESLTTERDGLIEKAKALESYIENAKVTNCFAEERDSLRARNEQITKDLVSQGEKIQGARFELHRILVGATGKTNKDVLNEIKRIRDSLGGEP